MDLMKPFKNDTTVKTIKTTIHVCIYLGNLCKKNCTWLILCDVKNTILLVYLTLLTPMSNNTVATKRIRPNMTLNISETVPDDCLCPSLSGLISKIIDPMTMKTEPIYGIYKKYIYIYMYNLCYINIMQISLVFTFQIQPFTFQI